MEEAISEDNESNLESSARHVLDEYLDLSFDDVITNIKEDSLVRVLEPAQRRETKLQAAVNMVVGNYMKQQMTDVSVQVEKGV